MEKKNHWACFERLQNLANMVNNLSLELNTFRDAWKTFFVVSVD